MIGARVSPRCELSKEKVDTNKKRLSICRKKQWHTFKVQDVNRKRRASLGLTAVVEVSSLCHHHHGEAKHNFEFIEDKDRQLESLWRETNIGNFMILSSPPSLSCFRL
jgi:hypothetical protein